MTWHDDDLDDDPDAWDAPDDEQDEDADDDDTVPCPACGEPMFEDSPRCPRCGKYVSAGVAAARPTWIVVTVLVCLAVAVWWVVGGLW